MCTLCRDVVERRIECQVALHTCCGDAAAMRHIYGSTSLSFCLGVRTGRVGSARNKPLFFTIQHSISIVKATNVLTTNLKYPVCQFHAGEMERDQTLSRRESNRPMTFRKVEVCTYQRRRACPEFKAPR